MEEIKTDIGMHPFFKHLYLFAAFALAFFIACRMTEKPDKDINYTKTNIDTVKVIHNFHPITNNYPTKVIVQKEVDSTFRKEAEKETIITGAEIKKGEVDIQKIGPDGKKTEEIHKIEEESTAIFDNKGFQEKKKTKAGKLLQKVANGIKIGLEVAGAIAIIIVAAK